MLRTSCIFAAALAFCLIVCGEANAAERLKKGDKVQVHSLGEWRPGVVVKTNKQGMALVEYEFAGSKQQEVFKRTDVRLAYVCGALSPPRFWRDSSGKSLGHAVLIDIDEKEVTLRKRDMSEFKVTIALLNKTDQTYLKRVKKPEKKPVENPEKKPWEKPPQPGNKADLETLKKAPKPPPVEEFEKKDLSAMPSRLHGNLERPSALPPDPLPGYLKLKEGGASFPSCGKIHAVLPIGGPDSWLLVAVENRLGWASLAKKKIVQWQLLPPGETVLDYYPPSHQLLTTNNVNASSNTVDNGIGGTCVMTLWRVVPTDKEVTPLVRWRASEKKAGYYGLWARLVAKNIVIQQGEKESVAWDAAAKRMLYTIEHRGLPNRGLPMSGGRKYLFAPEYGHVRVLESATGQLLIKLPGGGSSVGTSDDGRFVAVLSGPRLTIHDLANLDAKPQEYPSNGFGSSFSSKLNWIGPEMLLAKASRLPMSLTLYSLPRKAAIWNYTFDFDTARTEDKWRVREVADGHLVYAASQGDRQIVGAVKLPGPKVEETVASLDVDSLMILKQGTPVRLEVNAGEYNDQVRAIIEKKIKENGWKLDPNAPITVHAGMGRGDPVEISFWGHGQPNQKATVLPALSCVKICSKTDEIWYKITGADPSRNHHIGKGQTAQGEIDKIQKPNIEFFSKIEIPARIVAPKKSHGIGSTEITSKGLIATP